MLHAALDLAPDGVLAVEEPASSKQMKNWLLALSGSDVRAIDAVPRTCGSRLNSALSWGGPSRWCRCRSDRRPAP